MLAQRGEWRGVFQRSRDVVGSGKVSRGDLSGGPETVLAQRGEWRGLIERSRDGVGAEGRVEGTDPEVVRRCWRRGTSGGD